MKDPDRIIGIVVILFFTFGIIWLISNKSDASVSYEKLSAEQIDIINKGDSPWTRATIYDKRKLLLTYHGPDSCSGGIKSVKVKENLLIVDTTRADKSCGGAAGSIGGPYHKVINIPESFANNEKAKVRVTSFSNSGEIPVTINYQ